MQIVHVIIQKMAQFSDVVFWGISELKPETVYEVRMLAATSEGFPKLSEERWPWVEIKTLGDQCK